LRTALRAEAAGGGAAGGGAAGGGAAGGGAAADAYALEFAYLCWKSRTFAEYDAVVQVATIIRQTSVCF